jgi:hypothetical protein
MWVNSYDYGLGFHPSVHLLKEKIQICKANVTINIRVPIILHGKAIFFCLFLPSSHLKMFQMKNKIERLEGFTPRVIFLKNIILYKLIFKYSLDISVKQA